MDKNMLMLQAKKNMKYYIAECDVGIPWFRCPKKLTPYSEPVLITPAMAGDLLSSIPNFNLRKPTPPKILKQLVKLIKNEEIIKAFVIINLSGVLVDGANLLQGIVAANKSVSLFVEFNAKGY